MTLVSAVVERVRREFVEPPDLQPTTMDLDGAITAGASSLVYDDEMLTAEEENLLGPGTLIEIDYDGTNEAELILVGTVDATTNTCSDLKRGVAGTEAVAHDDGATIRIAPAWPRQHIRDALADAIVGLWPDLYLPKESPELTLSASTYTEAPADMEYAEYFWLNHVSTGTSDYEQVPVRQYLRFPPSSTNKAIRPLPGIRITNSTGYLVYRARFTRPTAETDDLETDLGLETEWIPLVIVSTVAYLIAGRDLHPALETNLVAQLETEIFPAGAGTDVRNALLSYERLLRDRAQSAQSTIDEVVVTRNGVVGG